MLPEFPEQLAAVRQLISKVQAVIAGTAADDLDLSTLDTEAVGLAQACFGNSGKSTVPQTIAYREAYDFVESHRRLNAVAGLSRADCYARAEEEYQRADVQLQYLDAVLQRLIRKGAPS